MPDWINWLLDRLCVKMGVSNEGWTFFGAMVYPEELTLMWDNDDLDCLRVTLSIEDVTLWTKDG